MINESGRQRDFSPFFADIVSRVPEKGRPPGRILRKYQAVGNENLT
jgi:hypothetical protein